MTPQEFYDRFQGAVALAKREPFTDASVDQLRGELRVLVEGMGITEKLTGELSLAAYAVRVATQVRALSSFQRALHGSKVGVAVGDGLYGGGPQAILEAEFQLDWRDPKFLMLSLNLACGQICGTKVNTPENVRKVAKALREMATWLDVEVDSAWRASGEGAS